MQINKILLSLALLLCLFGATFAKAGGSGTDLTRPGVIDFETPDTVVEDDDGGSGSGDGGGALGGATIVTSSATGAGGEIQAGICSLSNLINTVLTAVIFLLIVAAAVVYAGGQLLGAETRARATVWATSMFVGALIGVLIYVVVPMVLGAMMGKDITSCTA